MLSYTLIRSLIFALIISIGFDVSHAKSVHNNERTFYIYLTRQGNWCALKSRKAFMAEVKSSEASQLEADQVQVWIDGSWPIRVTEFLMDADGEWSTTSTYKLDHIGHVTAVQVIARSGEPPTDTVFNFNVAKGIYNPKVPESFSPNKFRMAKALTSFPFSQLIGQFSRDKVANKLCSQ